MTGSRTNRRALCAAAAIAALAFWSTAPAKAADQPPATDETFGRIATIQIPGNPLASFGTSWVDQVRQQYMLADRSNKALDVISTVTNTVAFQVPGFVGVTGADATSGPNGVTTVGHREAWVGDGNSTVKVVDLRTRTIVATISTDGTSRVNQLCYDRHDHVVMAANDFDTPPFVTFISTEGHHRVLGRIVFPHAGNGLQHGALAYCEWWNKTGLIYLSVAEFNAVPTQGEVAVIDPRHRTVVNTFPIGGEASGLAIGPNGQAAVGSADNSGIYVIDLHTGSTVAAFGIFGTDEVWFNPGDDHYFGASVFGSGALPSLAVLDADPPSRDQGSSIQAADHSLAADADTNQVYVATGPRPASFDPACTNGCISVFAAANDDPSERQQEAAQGQ